MNDIDVRYRGDDFRLAVPLLCVHEKCRLAVIGPSGSGKTTLLNVIAGIHLPERGEVHVAGRVVNQLSDRERRRFRLAEIGFVFQDFGLIDYLSALDNILHPYRISDTLRLSQEAKNRALELARSMGVDAKLHKWPGTLSQGEKQRVAICRALITRPRLILADEATGNLDPDNKERILDLLLTAADRYGSTLVAVTHDEALLPHFDRVVRIDDMTMAAA